ncbi:MAG: DUF21 domain-containing protein [Fibrobacter sp.]|jgi:putative hemolysin|nr:DUF21 domain-containing protein [Fibrobacter sp.]
MVLTLLILVTIIFLGVSAFFSASETALFSIPKERVSFFEGNPKKSFNNVFQLLHDGQRTMLLILLGNTFVNITLTGLMYSLVNRITGVQSPLLTLIIATLIIVIFGELLPKNIALKNNELIAPLFSPYLFHLKNILSPVLAITQSTNQFFLSRFRQHLRKPSPFITLEELKTGIVESARKGAILSGEQKIILGLLNEGVMPVRKLMIHRSLLQIIPENTIVASAIEKMVKEKQTFLLIRDVRYPEQVIGTVSLSKLMKADRKISVSKVIEPPVWVPESVEIAELVRFLLNTGNDKACVLDEFGSFCGVFALSTGMNKFLEVVFPLTAQPQRNADIKTMMFSGAQDIGQIQAWLPEELKNSDIEARTLNGLLTNYIGKIPKTGDRFVIDGWDFYIILANPTKIESVLIRKRNEDEY